MACVGLIPDSYGSPYHRRCSFGFMLGFRMIISDENRPKLVGHTTAMYWEHCESLTHRSIARQEGERFQHTFHITPSVQAALPIH